MDAVGGEAIVEIQTDRVVNAVEAMLRTASDATFAQPRLLSLVLATAAVGPMQAALDRGAKPELIASLPQLSRSA